MKKAGAAPQESASCPNLWSAEGAKYEKSECPISRLQRLGFFNVLYLGRWPRLLYFSPVALLAARRHTTSGRRSLLRLEEGFVISTKESKALADIIREFSQRKMLVVGD